MDANVKRIKLNNGIKAIIIPLKNKTKLTHVSASFFLGFNHENKKNGEISHYYEHLLGRLTSEKYKNNNYIYNELARRGAYTNAYINKYETTIFINGLYSDIDFFLDIISNSLNNFYIDDKIAKKEKLAVVQELNNFLNNYSYAFEFKIFKYLYPRYKYYMNHKNNIKNVRKFTMNDIKRFIKEKLCTNNLLITISCNNSKVKQTADLVKKYFSVIKKKNCKNIYPIFANKNKMFKVIYINNKNNNNVLIKLMVCKSIDYMSKEHLMLNIISNIMFNFNTGVFYKILRTKLGLIYNIGLETDIDIINNKSSSYDIYTECDKNKVPELILNILNIINEYDITYQEYANAIKNINLYFETKKFIKINSLDEDYKKSLLFNKPLLYNKDYLELYNNIKYNDIKEYYKIFSKNILTQGMLFYYSNKNLNKNINNILNNSIIKNKYKMLYI